MTKVDSKDNVDQVARSILGGVTINTNISVCEILFSFFLDYHGEFFFTFQMIFVKIVEEVNLVYDKN
jgi:hypothetical protein